MPAAPAAASRAASATISGAMWLEDQSGNAKPLRGVEIRLVPALVRVADVEPCFAKIAGRGHPAIAAARERLDELGPEGMCKMAGLLGSAYLTHPDWDSGDDARKFAVLKDDEVIPEALRRFGVGHASTSIDGRYRLAGVAPGDYLLYAENLDEAGMILWARPVAVRAGDEVALDLHEKNAELIQPAAGLNSP